MTTTPNPAAAPKGLTTSNRSVQARDPSTEFRDLLTRMRPQIVAALPKHLDPDRLLRIVLTTVRRTPALLQCSRESVLAGIMQAAQLGLEPDSNLGLAYLLPYGNQCQLVVGWKGLIELARRSGLVANITAHCVHYGDFFEYELGLDTKLRHIPADVLDMPQYAREQAIADGMRAEQVVGVLADGKRKSDLVAAYAVVTMKDGSRNFRVVTAKFVQKIRAMSKGGNHPSSPWVAWEEQMWEKTAVKQVLRFVPLSPEDKTVIEHMATDTGRTLSGIADVRTREALAEEPLPADVNADGEVTPSPAPGDGAPAAQAQPETPPPAARRPGRPRKGPPETAAPEDAISAPPPQAQAQAQAQVPRPPSQPVAPPPGPLPPTTAADPRQAGLFGDAETDDPGPGPDELDNV